MCSILSMFANPIKMMHWRMTTYITKDKCPGSGLAWTACYQLRAGLSSCPSGWCKSTNKKWADYSWTIQYPPKCKANWVEDVLVILLSVSFLAHLWRHSCHSCFQLIFLQTCEQDLVEDMGAKQSKKGGERGQRPLTTFDKTSTLPPSFKKSALKVWPEYLFF